MPAGPAIEIFARSRVRGLYLSALAQLAGYRVAEKEGDAPALFALSDGTPPDRAFDAGHIIYLSETPPAMPTGVRVLAPPLRAARVVETLGRMLRQETMVRQIDIAGHILDMQENLWFSAPDETPVRLTGKETAILSYLKSRGAAGSSREDLLARVWDYAENVETHTLETHIYRLRQKIETDPSNPEIILTKDEGYVLGGAG